MGGSDLRILETLVTPDLRAAIAAICISDSCRVAVSSVYDHARGMDIALGAEVRERRALAYDRASGQSLGGDLPELWHGETQAWVHLAATGAGAYQGHDRGSDVAFAVNVTGAVAQLFDHQSQAWTAYTGRLVAEAF
ncbi:MAG TPA: hypothetical protein VKI45_10785 [Allosphingosinicella sp.]|nr:hypothetical protein [Allosphingosinicella sp.]